MKKPLLLLFGALLAGVSTQAQYYSLNAVNIGINPGAEHTEQEQPAAFMTANYSGYSQVLNAGATAWSGVQNIPFTFNFNGGPVTAYRIAPTGLISFATNVGAVPSENNVALPTSMIPDSSICAWGLNIAGANDGVVTKTFGTAPNRQHWVIWASASASTMSGTQWTNWGIVLEETTNHIYVVDMRSYASAGGNVSLTVGVQIDTNEAYSVPQSPNVASTNTGTGGSQVDPGDNTYYLFGYGTQPAAELDNIAVTNDYYVEVNSNETIKCFVVNHGSSNVTSAQISYAIGAGTPVVDMVNGINIAPGAGATVNLPTAWNATTEGTFEITSAVIASNGNVETIITNNTSSTEVLVHPTAVPRKPLLEQFTSSTCAPCTPGNANVLSVMSAFPNEFSKVNYQMSWPGTGDPYYTLEGLARRTFYGVNSVPSMHTDGSVGMNSQSYTAAIFQSAQDQPAFVNLTISGTVQPYYVYAVQGGQLVADTTYELNASVSMNPVIDMPAGLVAHVSLQEDLTYNNIKTNGETEFHDVMKKMLPSATGTTLGAVAAGNTDDFSVSHTFPSTYRLPMDATDPIDHALHHSIEEWDDLRLVTWIQNTSTGEIWQSENAAVELLEPITNLEEETVDGITYYTIDGVVYEVSGDGKIVPEGVSEIALNNISLYPNPAQDVVNIKGYSGTMNVNVANALGQVVMNTVAQNQAIDVSSLASGVYTVTISTAEGVSVNKITVTK